jgi:hypothetical protein
MHVSHRSGVVRAEMGALAWLTPIARTRDGQHALLLYCRIGHSRGHLIWPRGLALLIIGSSHSRSRCYSLRRWSKGPCSSRSCVYAPGHRFCGHESNTALHACTDDGCCKSYHARSESAGFMQIETSKTCTALNSTKC